MRISTIVLTAVALLGTVEGFSTSTSTSPASLSKITSCLSSSSSCLYSTTAAEATDAADAAADTSEDEEMTIPTNLPSDCGMDYIPLATMLATGQFEEADQVRIQNHKQ